MEIQVNNTSLVVPAQESPKHRLWNSNLDLLAGPRAHVPLVYFYRPASDRSDFFEACMLKEALSKALVAFYPLAGRLAKDGHGRLEIDCTGEGALFVEAETSCVIDDEFGYDDFSPSLKMRQLVPTVDPTTDLSSSPLLVVQVTYFKCGGICLGIGWHHILGDGTFATDFINTWAKITRGFSISIQPFIDRTILHARIPPCPTFDHTEYHPPPSMNIKELQSRPLPTATARLKLSLDRISILKEKFKKDYGDKYSAYEIVAAHVWRCTCMALGLSDDQVTKLYIPINGRSRLNPPLPTEYFGNVVFFTASSASAGDIQSKPLINIVKIIHEAIKKVDDSYLRSSLAYMEQHGHDVLKKVDPLFKSPNLKIVSWHHMPMYDSDFGWGQPISMSRATLRPERTFILLQSPPNERSLSLLISLEAHLMKIFKKLFYPMEAGALEKNSIPSSL